MSSKLLEFGMLVALAGLASVFTVILELVQRADMAWLFVSYFAFGLVYPHAMEAARRRVADTSNQWAFQRRNSNHPIK